MKDSVPNPDSTRVLRWIRFDQLPMVCVIRVFFRLSRDSRDLRLRVMSRLSQPCFFMSIDVHARFRNVSDHETSYKRERNYGKNDLDKSKTLSGIYIEI